jgi:hypothetical protein
MYNRQQASILKQAFWTAFGKYMAPVPDAEGNKINWINYKTGVKQVYFRMEANSASASIAIEITHPDPAMRQQVFNQFFQLRDMLHEQLGEHWNWVASRINESGKEAAVINAVKKDVSVFAQGDWPDIISFLKPRLIALDNFWSVVKPMFE